MKYRWNALSLTFGLLTIASFVFAFLAADRPVADAFIDISRGRFVVGGILMLIATVANVLSYSESRPNASRDARRLHAVANDTIEK